MFSSQLNNNGKMKYEVLSITVAGNVAVLTISRPEAMNALNSKFFNEMEHLLDSLETRDDVRVMIITGEGKAFVAGADIAEMSGMNAAEGKRFAERGQNLFNRIEKLSFPVIAAVNGFALGGGCELAMACDIRIASSAAKFGQPEVNLGLIPGYAGTQRLPRIAGLSNALHMILTGDMITADDALRIGLVQKISPPETLLEDATTMAVRIASKGVIAVRESKAAIRKGMEGSFADGCRIEAEKFGSLFGNGESGEGMKAFLEKRKPNWG